ncbi:hypothetical protein BDU57DRAFT_567925 [Ampelomyces quisqualis]|uniref:Uncharacterized protein n=1 Tax=Ampelomyces quisqualis TaxID=50730 RepID=A0A6A5QVV9_AMPQU|nr:hypothetical protein BDU57DRAFT_567925 [Ampelomyces quisqualis]
MSDSDSDTDRNDLLNRADNRLSDFPLAPPAASVNAVITGLQRRFATLSERIGARSTPSRFTFIAASVGTPTPATILPFLPPSGFVPHAQLRSDSASTDRTDIDLIPMALPTSGPNQPVVTLVSALEPTPYNENKESNGEARTIAYIQVQRAVLLYLKTKASDSLSVKQARHWTRSIDHTGSRSPKAKDALRLCYYMRAQGFDVYARFEKKEMLLYIVNQTSHVRGKDIDTLYWSQNFSTNEIKAFANLQDAQFARRNAVSGGTEVLTGLQEFSNAARQRLANAQARAQGLRAANHTDFLRRLQARLELERA